MKALTIPVLALLALTTAGCYHTMVTTGATPGTRVVDKPWSMSFVYGLIPPASIDGAAECPTGVAIVETELSFMNQIVSALTGGLITPMHITITCAAGGMASGSSDAAEFTVTHSDDAASIRETVGQAADRAAESGQPVLVKFR